MADDAKTAVATPAKTEITIPADVQEKFPELIAMIRESNSMNTEEGQYWVDVLPIMTEDQIENLRSILVNEKTQIEAADEKYEQSISGKSLNLIPRFDEVAYKAKKKERQVLEKQHELEEEKREEDILKELENM